MTNLFACGYATFKGALLTCCNVIFNVSAGDGGSAFKGAGGGKRIQDTGNQLVLAGGKAFSSADWASLQRSSAIKAKELVAAYGLARNFG